MFDESQLIEQQLQAQGWVMTYSGCNHGITITACRHTQQITIYDCTYLGAWQKLAEAIHKRSDSPAEPEHDTTVA